MMLTSSIVATLLALVLKNLDIDVIAIDRSALRYIPVDARGRCEEILHTLANFIIAKKVYVCLDRVYGIPTGLYKGVTVLYAMKKGIESKAVVVKKGTACSNDITSTLREVLEHLLPRTPLFIIDLSLWELHHEKEKMSLMKQLVLTVNEIRRWLTDLNLVFVSTPLEVIQELQSVVPNSSTYFVTDEFYKLLPYEKTVVLDPYAEEELTTSDVYRYDYFVIGGVVDRFFPRPYATYAIYRLHRMNFVRKAIKLQGSTVGVPNEINKIVAIINSVRFVGIEFDEAIRINMSVDDKVARILYDLMRVSKVKKRIDISDVEELTKLYSLDKKYKHRILSFIEKSGHR